MRKQLSQRFLLLLAGILVSFSALAQTITVKGHVQDTQGVPVVFATVASTTTKASTNTDDNGNFTLQTQKGATLHVSYIGYKTVTVKAEENLKIVLEENNDLTEALVVGYAKVKKSDATGSVTALKPDALTKGLTTSAQDMLVGKVAGVNVASEGGQPGAGAKIRIRGGSSLNASNDPLIVIDGLAMDNEGVQGLSNALAMVNPEDIASYTVLKDASATAIYGSRASNGVGKATLI
jgi:susC, outer membrane protein